MYYLLLMTVVVIVVVMVEVMVLAVIVVVVVTVVVVVEVMVVAFEVRERNPSSVSGVLCIIHYPVQLISQVFFEIPFVSTRICLALRRTNLHGDSSFLCVC